MDIKSVNFFQNIKDTQISVEFVNLVRYGVAPVVWEDDQHRFAEASEGEKHGHQNERNRDNFLFSLFEALSHLLFSFRQYLVHILPCKESIKYSTENERSEDFEVVV